MDNYTNRGNGNKYPANKKFRNVGRSHDDEIHTERDRNDEYYSKKSKKPDPYYQDYQQKQQQQQQNPGSKSEKPRYERSYENRQSRQGSEPRGSGGLGANFSSQDSIKHNYVNSERSRDTRSSEPGGGNHYEHRNKPPSGQQRISNAALQRLPMNIDSLPPRLKKKYLLEAGLPEDLAQKPIMELTQQSYSNTLPSGRGRNNRYDQQNYHHQNYHARHNNNNLNHGYHNDIDSNSHHRSLTPPPSKSSRSLLQHQQKTAPSRYDWTNDIRREESSQSNSKTAKETDPNFDWSEDVLNSQSLPHEVNSTQSVLNKYDDNNRHRHRRRRNRSTSSNGSIDRTGFSTNENYQNNFKTPFLSKPGNNKISQRRSSQSSYNSRENSIERVFGYGSRDNSLDRRQHRRSRYNGKKGSDYQSSRENSAERFSNNWSRNDSLNNLRDDDGQSWRRLDEGVSTDQKIAELTMEFKNSVDLNKGSVSNNDQKSLFDPKNPSRPIVVQKTQTRPIEPDTNENYTEHSQYLTTSKPNWFKKTSEQYRLVKSKYLIDELDRLNDEVINIIENGELIRQWNRCQQFRERIQRIFEELLSKDMKFCQQEHVEHFFWKLLFYRIIEVLRKQIQECDEASRVTYKEKALETVDNGTKYFESLIRHLENCYKFQIEEYIGENAASYKHGMGYIALALVSTQKIFLFLGDLARYREQINQTNNFGRAKNFYVKAQQVVPKNGRPFNQLALLAVYSKRKIDAVYFYMRSLMSSNPFLPAKESLVALFDEIRKKYEFSQKKRDEKSRMRLKDKEHRFDGNLRRETWIHPDGGSRVHRTASLDLSVAKSANSTEDEELQDMDPSELNKRFLISFLHIQGKLITRIGMETFKICAVQMLKEFRALLHISPITINSHRLLQLISLNMYAIACTETKVQHDTSIPARSEVQECAIAVGLLMFGIILERFVELLKVSINAGEATVSVEKAIDSKTPKDSSNEPKKILKLNEDSKVMLPAIKAWCDWMMFHDKVWNPPPFCSDYKIGFSSNHDPWNGLATLLTLLEMTVDANKDYLSLQREKDYERVRLQEDVTLAGFTPLKHISPDPIFCRCDIDIEIVQNALRLQKLIFFGTDFLCKCSQPILKKVESHTGKIEYISIVQDQSEGTIDSEILMECYSDEEFDSKKKITELNGNGNVDKIIESPDYNSHHDAAGVRRLLRRKDELERKQKMEEKYNERLQDILSQSTVALHIEVRPRYLIPDTNCFVDDLISIKAIASAHPLYKLMIPITVINELEGLSRGTKPLTPTGIVVAPALSQQLAYPAGSSRIGNRNDPNHAAFVAQASKDALTFLFSKNPAVRCVTAKGSIINSAMFSTEDGSSEHKSNDDRILDTALNLCKKNLEDKRGEVRHIVREVVLLTTDRNLRVKALTNDIPVRELSDFIKWSGLGSIA